MRTQSYSGSGRLTEPRTAGFPCPLSDSATPAPKPLHWAPRPDGWSDIAWALPALERAVVAVPEHRAATGGLPALGAALAAVTTELRLQDERLSARMPDT